MTAQPFELIIFDWDGTLMDSAARIVACIQGAINELGWEPRTDAEVRDIIGLGLLQACTVLYPNRIDAHHQLAEAYQRRFFDTALAPSVLFAGAHQVLSVLGEQGYRLAVATGKSRNGLNTALRDSGLEPLFETSRCADETRSKPDPLMLHEILEELDVAADRALMVGDTEYDLAMAVAAKMPCVGVSYGVHEKQRLLQYRPLGVIEAINVLPQLLADLAADKVIACE